MRYDVCSTPRWQKTYACSGKLKIIIQTYFYTVRTITYGNAGVQLRTFLHGFMKKKNQVYYC